MNVLVMCEYSGRVRDAFNWLGHYAISVDLLATEGQETALICCADGKYHTLMAHHQGDCFDFIDQCAEVDKHFDLIIAHPPCTYLTIAAEWAYKDEQKKRIKPGTLIGAARREAREEALRFIDRIWSVDCPRLAIENPVGVIPTMRPNLPKPYFINPYDFGEDASKKTGITSRGLPQLKPTKRIAPRMVDGRPRWGNQTDSGQNKLAPSPDRWKDRSRTYQGIADAMAEQWGA